MNRALLAGALGVMGRALIDNCDGQAFGFHESLDTEEMLLRLFARLQKMRFIPS